MEFRRIPFQFTSTDPAKRQAELQKRFGLPPKQEKMYIDLANPGLMNTRKKESNSASSSPRLQHRVPIFVDGMSEADKSDANPTNVDAGQKSRVYIVPIEIENPDGSKRHRTFSGSSCVNGNSYHQGSWISDGVKPQRSWLPDNVKPKVESTSSKSPSGPKVHTIPVKIDGADTNSRAEVSCKKEQTPKAKPVQKNGCNVTKVNNEENKVPVTPACKVSLKKINIVLEKLIEYQSDVEKFSGTVKEKQYKYLDEMLTRLMLDLDNVETMGNENVRLERKAAIKKVQHCIDLLESKVNDSNQNQTESNAEVPEVIQVQPSEAENEYEIMEMVHVGESSKVVAGGSCDSNIGKSKVPEVETEDSMTNAQGSKAVDSTEMHMKSQQVQSMETENAQTISVKNDELVSEIGENGSMQNLTECNAGLSNVVQVSSSGDVDGLRNINSRESEIPEVEMEDPVTDTQALETSVEVSEMQIESCQGKSMETDTAENMASVGSEPMSELGKDCSIHIEACDTGNEPSSVIVQNAVELSSDSICESIPDVKTDFHLESMPFPCS